MINSKGGKPARIGINFHLEIEKIKKERILKGTSNDKISTEKITNLIVRHKEAWKIIFEDIINLNEDEVEKYGLK